MLKKKSTYAVTAEMRKELDRLAAAEEPNEIDLSDGDVPDVANWDGAVRGKFYRPVKKPVTIRIDADVLAWFRSRGDRYQTRINRVLREYMLKSER